LIENGQFLITFGRTLVRRALAQGRPKHYMLCLVKDWSTNRRDPRSKHKM